MQKKSERNYYSCSTEQPVYDYEVAYIQIWYWKGIDVWSGQIMTSQIQIQVFIISLVRYLQ